MNHTVKWTLLFLSFVSVANAQTITPQQQQAIDFAKNFSAQHPKMDGPAIQAIKAKSTVDSGFQQSCLNLVDKAAANGFTNFAGMTMSQLKAKMSSVTFYDLPAFFNLDYGINQGHSAVCVQSTDGTANPYVFLNTSDVSTVESQGGDDDQASLARRESMEGGLCAHEAFCGLGYGDENYAMSTALVSMADNMVAPLLKNATIPITAPYKIQQTDGGSGTAVGGGGDLESQMLKQMIIITLETASTPAEYGIQLDDRPDLATYQKMMNIALDCEFDLVDMSQLLGSRSEYAIPRATTRQWVNGYYYYQVNRLVFYIDEDKYNALNAQAAQTKDNAPLKPFFAEVLSILQDMAAKGQTGCTLQPSELGIGPGVLPTVQQ